mmetsp:Transcript_49845/g.56409  ORF Transcript_49845/g.56409 Transcript_49845/m.56409 type:complete len:381 (+) Transcript_49845:88-1230(+)
MVASLKERADAATKEIGTLSAEIQKTLASKRDPKVTLVTAAAAASSGTAVAEVRKPATQIKCRRKLEGHFGKITAIDWSGDGNTIVSASQDGNLLIWDAYSTSKKQDVRLKSASQHVMSVCMEQTTGRFVACGGLDNACSVYEIGQPEGKAVLKAELVKHEGYLSDCHFFHSPSKMLTSSADETTLLWDVEHGSILHTFQEHKANILSVALVGQTNFLSTSIDKTIKLWDVRSSAKEGSVQTFTGHEADVNGITVVGSSGNTFATCSEDGTVRVWDCRSYGEVAQFGELLDLSQAEEDPFGDSSDMGFTSITSSHSGRLLFCGHSEGSVECFDVLTNTPNSDPYYTLHNAHEIYVSCVKVSPVGNALCTASWDTKLKLFA